MFDDAWAWLEAVSWWKGIYWLVGTFGVVGAGALLLFAPQAFGIAFRAVVKFFQIVLSYRIGCAITAAIAAAFIADYHRHSIDDAEFAQRTALFEHAQKERDERIRTETRDLVWTEIANQTAANAVTDNEVKEFHDALPPVPHTGNPFRVGPAAVKLRQIAGQAERRPQGAKRVPAARSKGRS